MSNKKSPSEYLVISRGQWDEHRSPQEIQKAIDAFYEWHGRLVSEGKMKSGQRLAPSSMMVSKHGITDGPFTETKEVIGGYWLIVAASLEEAATLAAENPCMQRGLFYEIRPIDQEPASAYTVTNETPGGQRR